MSGADLHPGAKVADNLLEFERAVDRACVELERQRDESKTGLYVDRNGAPINGKCVRIDGDVDVRAVVSSVLSGFAAVVPVLTPPVVSVSKG